VERSYEDEADARAAFVRDVLRSGAGDDVLDRDGRVAAFVTRA
jgi:hypothetical protein